MASAIVPRDVMHKSCKEDEIEMTFEETCQAYSGALHPSIGPSWFHALKPEFQTDKFKALNEFLTKERQSKTIYPPQDQVWSWTQHFEVKDTKVVILGQDPYHSPNKANGLCFSVKKTVTEYDSLWNIFEELESDIEGFQRPEHGDLTGWAKQGVLLLNACLTVEKGKANAHKDQGWELITDAVIKKICDQCNNVVFLLWGINAKAKTSIIDSHHNEHHHLQAPHPSPANKNEGFIGCKHFSKCNDLLKKFHKEPIDWAQLD